MRNLLGRLNARTPEELSRIATAWQTPVAGGDKLGQVAQLYRAMSDPRSVRDMWGRLSDDERALIAQLALGDEASRSIVQLAERLNRPQADVRSIAVDLYHKGIVVREGDDDPLPVGQAPRLFLPRELADKFQRVQDEIETGDVSSTPLRTLLSLLDEREVEEAAQTWGVRVIPGIRTRDEIIRQVLQHAGDPQRLAAVERTLKQDARQVWNAVRAAGGKAMLLADAVAAAGLSTEKAGQAFRVRQALAELEEALLVWHTFHSDGSRWLFIPIEIRSPEAAAVEQAPAPQPVQPPNDLPPSKHAHAVAWDLLTLLRALSPTHDQRVHDVNDAPRGWLRRLNATLWNRDADLPPAGYLEFLVDLARVEGVLTGGDAAIEEPFVVSPTMRNWRDRTFAEQTERLRAIWLSSSSWIEGEARDDVDVWGADWPGFRFKLLAQLAKLDAGAFYPLDVVASWLAARDPEMLGNTFEVATARNTEVVFDEAASRRAAVAEVVAATLESAFRWFGLVEIVRVPRKPRVLRITPVGAALARGRPIVEPETDQNGPAVTVEEDGEVVLAQPTPLRVWSLSAFAETAELTPVARYRITEQAIAQALRAGFAVRDVERFLVSQSGSPLPADLFESISHWSAGVRRVTVTRMLQLQPDDPALIPDLSIALQAAGVPAIEQNGMLFIPFEAGAEMNTDEARILNRLREAGFTPHLAARTRSATPSQSSLPDPESKSR